MTPSTILIDIAAIAVFALLIAGAVWLGLRPFLNRDPDARPTGTASKPRPAPMRWLLAVGFCLLLWVFIAPAHVAQAGFGAPIGERTTPVMEVVEVDGCRRPVSGFGLVHLCEAAVDDPGMPGDSYVVEVVTGSDTVEPGDHVAQYFPSGWVGLLQFFSGGPQWRSLDDTEKPNLVWLQAAALVLALLAARMLDERLRARHRAAPEATGVR